MRKVPLKFPRVISNFSASFLAILPKYQLQKKKKTFIMLSLLHTYKAENICLSQDKPKTIKMYGTDFTLLTLGTQVKMWMQHSSLEYSRQCHVSYVALTTSQHHCK